MTAAIASQSTQYRPHPATERLDTLDRIIYRMTPTVVAAIGNMIGSEVWWPAFGSNWMSGELLALNVDGTVQIRRSVYGGVCTIHWSKVPCLVQAWESEKESPQ